MIDPFIPLFIVSIWILVLPFKFWNVYVHSWLTKRDYSYSIDDTLDRGIAVCVLILLIKYA